jgi:hypothetical protein
MRFQSPCTTCTITSAAFTRRYGLPLAMAAGMTDKLWSIGDIVKVLEDWEDPKTNAKPKGSSC